MAHIIYEEETTTVLTFKQEPEDVEKNSSFLFCKEEKDAKVNVFYTLKGTWIFYTEPTLFWLDPPSADYKITGYLRPFVSCDPRDKEELEIRPPYTTEKLEGPAYITADISMPQDLILHIAHMNRASQPIWFSVTVGSASETLKRSVSLMGLVCDLISGKPPEMPCIFKVVSWAASNQK
jgi:hypothetical protein